MIERLETDRLVLRRPTGADEPAFLAWYASPRRVAVRGAVSVVDAWDAYASVIGHWVIRGFGRFIVEEKSGGGPLGLIGPHQPGGFPDPELAWHLWTDAGEGKGIGTEAARAAKKHAIETLGLTGLVSYIKAEYTRSVRLAQRLGARPDGEIALFGADTYGIWRHTSEAVT